MAGDYLGICFLYADLGSDFLDSQDLGMSGVCGGGRFHRQPALRAYPT